MKITKKILTVILSLMMVFSYMQAVSASENLMNIVLEDVTDSADTLTGEAKIKVSVKGIDGSLTLSQLKFNFSGNGSFKSIAYSDEINKLVKSSGTGQPFFVQPIDAKSANSSKSFDIAFSGSTKYSLPVSASGTELGIITFSGDPNEEITLAINDLEDSFCVVSPGVTEPQNHVAAAVSITVKCSSTTKTGVKLAANINLNELKESGGFADNSQISLKLTNLESNQVRTFKLSDADKIDAVSYKFEIDKLAAGKYDISLVADGFVSKALSNVDLSGDKQINITSDNFYAGDVNADGKLTLRDYNRFISMYNAKSTAYDGIDYNRDDKLSQYDLLAFIASAENHIETDAKGNVPATLKAVASSNEVKKGDSFTVTLILDADESPVNSYYIKASYPSDIATLEKAECSETNAENKAVNIAENGKLVLLNRVSDGTKKDIYKLTFKAVKDGAFTLSFDNAEGALLYDVNGDAEDMLLNISVSNSSVTVKSSSNGTAGGGGGGGGGGSSSGGGSTGGGSSSGGFSGGGTATTPTEAAKHNAYVSGYEDKTIRPDSNITRAEAAALISRIGTDFSTDTTYDVSRFTDIEVGAWFAKNVGYVAEKGIVSGYEDGSFRPNDNIMREEFAAMICRFLKYDTSVTEVFSDVPTEHWAAPYISAMKSNGIISGYEDGSFGMGKKITRAEAVAIMNRALGRVPNEEKISSYVSSNGYPATDIEGHWAAAHLIEASVTHDASILH